MCQAASAKRGRASGRDGCCVESCEMGKLEGPEQEEVFLGEGSRDGSRNAATSNPST